MSSLEEIEKAAKESTEKVLREIGRISDSQFESIMAELRKNGVDAKIIAELEAVVNDSTRRNKCLAEIVRKGGRVGEIVGRVVRLSR